MGTKLYVGNLSFSTDSSELESLFSQAGSVSSANVITDRDTGRSKGFGFVEMGTDAEAQDAVAKFDGYELGGRNLRVSEAKPREDRGDRGGYSRGGGRGGWSGGRNQY